MPLPAVGNNDRPKWIQNQSLDQSSSVNDWMERLLREAIHNLASARNSAVRIAGVCSLLVFIVPFQPDEGRGSLKAKSFWWVGESGRTLEG
eukprot:6478457-Amphidinium_carterae.1